jgi:hypothetical protein
MYANLMALARGGETNTHDIENSMEKLTCPAARGVLVSPQVWRRPFAPRDLALTIWRALAKHILRLDQLPYEYESR